MDYYTESVWRLEAWCTQSPRFLWNVSKETFLMSVLMVHCSERTTADTMLMKELEGVLADARDLESYLKEKKQHLRQTLDVISEKLQR